MGQQEKKMKNIVEALRAISDESINLLKTFVEIESFSYDKAGIDRLSEKLTEVFGTFPVEIERYKESEYGDHISFQLGNGDKQLLLISHLDTVYPKGTIDRMPFKVQEEKVLGPGVIDIKASYVMVYHLFSLLREVDLHNYKIKWLLTSDEEIGSPSGRVVVREEAAKSEVVLVLEPATDLGELKTARKGGGKFTIDVSGVSAHAGLNPQDGANAIEELAHQITKIASFADHSKGTTVNTGEIKGGNLFNVVPDFASAEIDVRVAEENEVIRIEKAFSNLSPLNKKTNLNVSGSIYRPPLIKTEQTIELFTVAARVSRHININLKEAMVGGGSDGNFAAQMNVPVLDGLGAYGGGAHSPNEFLRIDSIAERTAIVFGLIQELLKTNP
jgi:glutamate carboxypeptidase